MTDTAVSLSGEVDKWPSKRKMAIILRRSGLNISVGTYSISIDDCDYFKFQEYGGDLGKPVIIADADSVADMLQDGKKVSDALRSAGIRHRFEIYDHNSEMVGYLHYGWPLEGHS